jgi:carboxyl-terminal processing protease
MPAPIRALIVALAVVGAFFAGALYFGYHEMQGPARVHLPLGDQIASLTLNVGSGDSASEQLLREAFDQVQYTYYRQVNPQTIVDGERRGLLSYLQTALKKKNVKPSLPPAGAASDETQAIAALDRELAFARSHYAPLGASPDDMTQAALSGMLNSLGDPYTEYLSPRQIGALNEQLNGGDFGGIGVFIYQLKNNGGILLVPLPNQPAARSGMRDGQILLSINGQAIKGFPIERVEKMIRGPEGTQVVLKTHVYKGSVLRTYSITRQIIHLPTVSSKMEKGYDYIRLSDFGQTSAGEVRKALAYGKTHGAKGYIFDLRFNGGGLLDAAVDISSYFIPSGTIVTEIQRGGERTVKEANGSFMSGLRPAVVLVNGYTASASEITAGALQDYKAAKLVGTQTYGKGVVQGIFKMDNGGALKITTERYETPSGRDIRHKGIAPDITVAQPPDFKLIDTPKDKQLQAAMAYLDRITR